MATVIPVVKASYKKEVNNVSQGVVMVLDEVKLVQSLAYS